MEIVIRFANGQLQVAGAIGDKVVALGMIEMAKSLILQQPAVAAPGIQVPSQPVAKQLLNGCKG